ncbi:MAG: hypothetical protein EPN22_15025 [Nitrospirae bacterium]|nr:MAG: hypothetical protein EPN22_15025 [Nitrospirota bacterium]
MRFFDAHCHVMNLSHPNLSAILNRILDKVGFWKKASISALALFLWLPWGKKALTSVIESDDRIMNLLAIMESDLGDFILQMEEDLKERLWKAQPVVIGNNGDAVRYDKIVLTPLMMDFGLKNYGKYKTVYKVRRKTIEEQMRDLLIGIRRYRAESKHRLFEVYPFMGLNTKNYGINSYGKTVELQVLLDKYFKNFDQDPTPKKRLERLNSFAWDEYQCDIDAVDSSPFLGIKLYPPLGFDPWPEDSAEELGKVKFLYDYCVKKNIPVTSHCSDGGFLVDDSYLEFSSPAKWRKALSWKDPNTNTEPFRNLRLNLAHFGNQEKSSWWRKKEWRDQVTELVCNYDNVYTDISYRGGERIFYDELKGYIKSHPPEKQDKLMQKIIFGSDFMINLMSVDSYSTYLKHFATTSIFSADEKDLFCRQNPERFLFI